MTTREPAPAIRTRRPQAVRLAWALAGALAGALAWGAAQAEPRAPAPSAGDAYLPLFVMYSGTPAPEQLLALRQFLATHDVPREVIRDTVQTVVYKLKTFKAGFAYPVFRDDTSTSGHACVVADSRHDDPAHTWTVLASERVYRPLLEGRAAPLDPAQLLEHVFAHELFHCYDAGRDSLEHIGEQIVEQGAAYVAYWGEAGADVYAALQHLRQGGGPELLRTLRDYRTVNLLNGDTVHYTAGVLDYVLAQHGPDTLRGLNTRQLIALADRIRAAAAMSPQQFSRLEGAAAVMSREYQRLLAGYPGLAGGYDGSLMQPSARAVSPDYSAALLARVGRALFRLGGRASVDSPYFAPLVARFGPPPPAALVRAD
jgi:hypothetical protein